MILDTLIESARHEHSRKVSIISGMLAGYAGYSTDEAALIEQAALFHDAGKTDIPPEILNKPGVLTTQEFSVIKTHARKGGNRIKEALRVLAAARLIAENHHEKLDGTGYHGLTTTGIHPYARLVAVADVLDALLSKRAYKDSWGMDETLGYIKSGAGTHFDVDIVTALLVHSDEIMSLYA